MVAGNPVIERRIKLHKSQFDFVHATAPFSALIGGRGSGKSFGGAYRMVSRAQPGRTYLVASPTGVLMADTTWPCVEKITKDLGLWESVKMSPYPTLRLSNGATIRFRSAEEPERLRGPNLSSIWLDEAALMHKNAYLVCIASLREGGQQGGLTATTTPAGTSNWVFDVFGHNKPDTQIFFAKTKDNPWLPPDFEHKLRQQYSGLRAQQELDGRFVAMEGSEFPAEWFGDEMWFEDWLPLPYKCRVMALDPSKGRADKPGDYSCWIKLGVDEQLCLWAEADLSNTRPVEPSESDPTLPSIIGDGLTMISAWKPDAVVVESNGFQELVAVSLARALRQAGLMRVPIYVVNNTQPKDSRIRGLGPYLAQKRLRIRKNKGGLLLQGQLMDFPLAEYRDAPDALKMAEVLADYLITGSMEGQGRPEILRA